MSQNDDFNEMQRAFETRFSPNSDEMDAMYAMDDYTPPAPQVYSRCHVPTSLTSCISVVTASASTPCPPCPH